MRFAIALALFGVGTAFAQSCPEGTTRITTGYGSYCGAHQVVTVAEPQSLAVQTCPAGTTRIATAYGSYCGSTQPVEKTQAAQPNAVSQQRQANSRVEQSCPSGTVRVATSYGSYCGASQPASSQQSLVNHDILELLKAGLSAEIVTAKIKVSNCNFDTSPAALKLLKDANVPDSVILAMVQAPVTQIPAVEANAGVRSQATQ